MQPWQMPLTNELELGDTMLKLQRQLLPYHGWQIEALPEGNEFLFHCYPPDLSDFCNDGCFYSTVEAAIEAAYEFVDREIAIHALIDIVNDWLDLDLISEDEYWNLTNFE